MTRCTISGYTDTFGYDAWPGINTSGYNVGQV